MPGPDLANPYVTSATLADGQLTFSVRVDDLQGDQEVYVKISGYATQTGGAFANIYAITPVPPKTAGNGGTQLVYVTATPSPEAPAFRKDQDVTVTIEAAMVWATVLKVDPNSTEAPPVEADNGTTWGQARHVAEMYGPRPRPGFVF